MNKINLNFSGLQTQKFQSKLAFKGNDSGIIMPNDDDNFVLMTGENRKNLSRAVDKFEKTLVKDSVEGDEATVERLKDADTALTLASRLQDIGKGLFVKAQDGIKAIHERPFNEERPKQTIVEKEIEELGETVKIKIGATKLAVVNYNPEIEKLLIGGQTELINAGVEKNAILQERVATAEGRNQQLQKVAYEIGDRILASKSGPSSKDN